MKRLRRKRLKRVPFPRNQLYYFSSPEFNGEPEDIEVYWAVPSKVHEDTIIVMIAGVGQHKTGAASAFWFNGAASIFTREQLQSDANKVTNKQINHVVLWNNHENTAKAIEEAREAVRRRHEANLLPQQDVVNQG